MKSKFSSTINDTQFQEIPLENKRTNKKLDYTAIKMGNDDEPRFQKKRKWYNSNHSVALISIIVMMAIVLLILAGINIYQSKKVAAATRTSPCCTHIPITAEPSSTITSPRLKKNEHRIRKRGLTTAITPG